MRVSRQRRHVQSFLAFSLGFIKVSLGIFCFYLVFMTLYFERSSAQFLSRPCALSGRQHVCPFASKASLMATVARLPQLSLLTQIIQTSGLDGDLNSPQTLTTLFAPTNEAFLALPAPILQALQTDPSFAQRFLKHHLVPGAHPLASYIAQGSTFSHGGSLVDFVVTRNHVNVRGAAVVQPDIPCTNGTVQVVNKSLAPDFL